MAKRKLWRHTEGRKGVNRVTVYEREAGAQLYVEWWDDLGRHQRALGSLIGEPVTDKELAVQIAKDMAAEQEKRRNELARARHNGQSLRRTVGELLEALHHRKWRDWSESYRKDQTRFRRFWEDRLGRNTEIRDVTPAMVEEAVAREAEAKGWGEATQGRYLRYIVDAFAFGQRRLKWLTEADNLSAVEVPSTKGASHAYTDEEARRLVRALEEVDPRAGFLGHVAYQTGRRLGAIRNLTRDDVAILEDEGVAVITFPGEWDKARNTGQAAVAGRGLELARALLLHGRHYLVSEEDGSVVTEETAIRGWLRDAERRAGIEHIKGRGYHGIKRRWATMTRGMDGRDKQAGTLEQTLESHYVQDDTAPKIAIARRLAAEVEEG